MIGVAEVVFALGEIRISRAEMKIERVLFGRLNELRGDFTNRVVTTKCASDEVAQTREIAKGIACDMHSGDSAPVVGKIDDIGLGLFRKSVEISEEKDAVKAGEIGGA